MVPRRDEAGGGGDGAGCGAKRRTGERGIPFGHAPPEVRGSVRLRQLLEEGHAIPADLRRQWETDQNGKNDPRDPPNKISERNTEAP